MSGEHDTVVPAAPGILSRFMGAVSAVCMYVAGAMLVGIVVINGWNVFSRYVLYSALSWAEEAMVFLMLGSVCIGAIPVTWDRAHIRIDAFVQSLPPGPRKAVEWLAVALTAAILLPVGWLSYSVVVKLMNFDQRSDALHLPVWIPQSALPIALLLIPIVMALALWRGGPGPHDELNAAAGDKNG
jgi:TRAP-type C4-dicarboxylate transport system permease small subunit